MELSLGPLDHVEYVFQQSVSFRIQTTLVHNAPSSQSDLAL